MCNVKHHHLSIPPVGNRLVVSSLLLWVTVGSGLVLFHLNRLPPKDAKYRPDGM